MSHPLHHSISSRKKWGGSVDDYLPIHNWLDATRVYYREMRHRSMRHHVEGFSWCEQQLGMTIKNLDGLVVPVRMICEQHCMEDVGFIPQMNDFLVHIKIQDWIRNVVEGDDFETETFTDDSKSCCTISKKRWGGSADDYLKIHNWFLETSLNFPDKRHFAMRHHAEGILWCEEKFGAYIINSEQRMVPVRDLAEHHVQQAIGFIPSIRHWLDKMSMEDWMYRPGEGRDVMKDIRHNKLDYIK